MEELLTVVELAERLKLNPTTVYRWVSAGRLTCVRFSARCLRFRQSEVETLLNKMTYRGNEEEE